MKAGREKILLQRVFDAVNESVDDFSRLKHPVKKQSRRSEYGMGFSIKESSNRGRRGCKSSLPPLIQELIHRTRMKMRLEPKEKVFLTQVWPALVFLLNEFFFLLHSSGPEQQDQQQQEREKEVKRREQHESDSGQMSHRDSCNKLCCS